MVEIFKALADENRLRVFIILLYDELCVCELEVILNLSQSNVSKHLSKLRAAGIIESQKDAQWVHYKVSEAFKLEQPELVKALEKSILANIEAMDDLRRLKRYREAALNCQEINKDRAHVIETINKEWIYE